MSFPFRVGVGSLGALGQYSINYQPSIGAIEAMIAQKFDYIDTASVYGSSKHKGNQLLGKMLDSNRKYAFVNKIGADLTEKPDASDVLMEDHNRSFEDLKVKKTAAVLLHRPQINLVHRDIPVIERLKRDFRVASVGICTNSLDVYQCYRKHCKFDILQIAVNLLDYQANIEILQIAKDDQVHVQARSVLASGILAGKYKEDSVFFDSIRKRFHKDRGNREIFRKRLEKARKIEQFYQRNQKTLGGSFSTFGYRAMLCNSLIGSVIFGGSTARQINENFAHNSLPIDIEFQKEIVRLAKDEWRAPYL